MIEAILSFRVHVNNFFLFYVSMNCKLRAELNLIREPSCFARGISCYFGNISIVLQRLRLGFDQGFDSKRTCFESNKIIKQTTSSS